MQLPQLDFDYYPSQLFWLVICYSFLYLILKFVILPKFSKIYKKREEFLNTALATAKESTNNAQQLLETRKQQLLEAKKTIEIKINQTTTDAEKSFNEKKLIIDQKYALTLKKSDLELQEFKGALKQNINIEIAKSSSLILEKVFNITVPFQDILNDIKDNQK